MTIMNATTPTSHNILSKKKLSLKRLSQKMLREMALQSYMLNQPPSRHV